MKKILALVLALAMVLSLVACGSSSSTEATAETAEITEETATTEEAAAADSGETYEIALITDVGNIDDHSFNQGTWEGVKQYAEDNGISYNYYRPSEDSTEARVETIKSAIDKGAKVVVCPGYLFEEAIFTVQEDYPDVKFLLLDGEPHNADYSEYKTADNVHCILYHEEQAGYLAGYAAVKEGFTKLGFLGGMEVPAVQRYGYGFIQGAEAAAAEMGVDVTMNYWYCGSFSPSDDIKVKMDSWYSDGVECVFSCGGGIYLSSVAAAEANNGKVIGVDVDQANESEVIVTSAMKKLGESTIQALTALYDNDLVWPEDLAGSTSNLGAADGCVGLPTEESSWRLNNFTVEEYDEEFAKLVSGEVTVSNATDAVPATTHVTVDVQS